MITSLKNRRAQAGEGGFTLIELLIVIVILGILAAVVVFSVRGITDQGEQATCRTTRSAVITASEAYRAQNGVYPANLALLTAPATALLNLGDGVSVATNTLSSTAGGGWSLPLVFTTAAPPTGDCDFA
ncbi:MAG: type II secretion system protein [Acidimicrobiia bacterium]